jgi:peptide/nickel transport system permease protein
MATLRASIPDFADAVTGVQLAQGIGVQPARGFWADAWSQVLKQSRAVFALCWLSVVAFFAVFSPLLVSGHPLMIEHIGPGGEVTGRSSPLLSSLRASDVVLMVGTILGVPWILLGSKGRAARLGVVLYGGVLAGMLVVLGGAVQGILSQRDPPAWARALKELHSARFWVAAALVVPIAAIGLWLPAVKPLTRRATIVGIAAAIGAAAVAATWVRPLPVFDYIGREQSAQIRAVYTMVPWSPAQRFSELDRRPPMTRFGDAMMLPPGTPGGNRVFLIGTDALGQDVLAQLLHACRLAISIGLVSTGIAVLIGVTIGSLMGYFGGWVDTCLFRMVEVFMAVPLLFLLILAAAVLPEELRSTYTMMAIIGCFTWTGAARFTRAEFLKLRSQDFVQSARAVGLPLRSILFRHMLPNGVTPVLVDASFAIAAAITIEATLSFLGLGPVDQASWGKLLASATNAEGQFKWWLAVFPGGAIFLTVLSYNMIGEALRDAIDPKLKKARV